MAAVSRKHRNAVTRMLRVTGLSRMADEAPLVELVKELASEMDLRPGARTRADYLSALKDVRRVLDGAASRLNPPAGRSRGVATSKKVQAETEEVAPAPMDEDELTTFRKSKGIA